MQDAHAALPLDPGTETAPATCLAACRRSQANPAEVVVCPTNITPHSRKLLGAHRPISADGVARKLVVSRLHGFALPHDPDDAGSAQGIAQRTGGSGGVGRMQGAVRAERQEEGAAQPPAPEGLHMYAGPLHAQRAGNQRPPLLLQRAEGAFCSNGGRRASFEEAAKGLAAMPHAAVALQMAIHHLHVGTPPAP
jgi:hypothetical protein